MTKAEWRACTDPQKMLAFLRAKASDRKFRLFAVACIRPYQSLLDKESLRALAVAERFAEGMASHDERKQARRGVLPASRRLDTTIADRRSLAKAAVHATLARRPYCAALKAAECARQIGVLSNVDLQADVLEKTQCGWNTADWTGSVREQVLLQVNILHDLFDGLFRPVSLDPEWRSADVLNIARAIYDEHAFDGLPALADALEATGHDDEELLTHCRNGKPHHRGCWVVDLILGIP